LPSALKIKAMATVTLEYDARNKVFEKLIDALVALGAKRKTESTKGHYDAEFVAKIRKAEKQTSKHINLKDYGINI